MIVEADFVTGSADEVSQIHTNDDGFAVLPLSDIISEVLINESPYY